MSLFSKTLYNRLRSFGYAFSGIIAFLKSEPNGRIHALATAAVIVAGCWLGLTTVEWCVILVVTGLVWITEMLNTAIEKAMDHLAPERHERVKFVKDVAAGAVLISAVVAVAAGLLIFVPKVMAII
ncbi:diacylglycerol kinase [uncultured Chitinophaga sp.]|uniref:diacylglycerol kinase n=1 Tax=uncultured Chitinophaga sp. TaxID=339340 RepID=UPI0025E451EA|nr:diacylglycerol kinase family protein [uncultured Chitinophaga sp.]